MTELERLVRQIRVHYPVTLSLNEENDLVEMLNRKYSVTLRNTDSSTDNTSDEQLHSDEELMSKIEDIALELADNFAEGEYRHKIDETSYFQKHTRKQFAKAIQTHRNTVSKPVKQKDGENYMISQKQLEIAFGKFASGHRPGEESWSDYDQQALDHVLGGANVKDDNLVNEKELRSKMTDMLGQIKRRERMQSFMVNTVEEVDQLVKLFKTYQNSVLRPVNNSDEQSIIK